MSAPTLATLATLRRIAELYVIEADILRKSPDERLRGRQTETKPLLSELGLTITSSVTFGDCVGLSS